MQISRNKNLLWIKSRETEKNRKEEEYYNWKDDWSRLKSISTKDKYLFFYPHINVALTTHSKNFLPQIDTTTVDNNLSKLT